MFWLILALLTGAAVFSVLWPLSRPAPRLGEDAADVAFYRAQIVEIDSELLRGTLSAEQAETAKAQAGRRLLAAAPDEAARGESPNARKIAALVAILVIPAVALGLYGLLGHPDQPDLPLEARLKAAPAKQDFGAVIAKMEAHIAAHPEDGKAQELMAPIYMRQGRFADAVKAREAALKLLGETAERHVRLAEAIAYANDGVIGPETEQEVDRALQLDPKQKEARYFLGLSAAQHDEKERARDIWRALIAELPEGSAARNAVEEKLGQLDAPAEGAAPSPQAAEAVRAQPADEQQKTIRAMVERLAQRLAAQGGNAEEWARLIRAYKVLNEQDRARATLADARKALQNDPAALKTVDETASQLGLESK